MGSQFLSRDEAMARLGASKSTLYRYVRKGYLRTQRVGNSFEVLESDLEQFKKSHEQGLPFAVNKFVLASIIAEVRTLRKEMDTVTRVLNLRHERLSLTDAEMVAYYRTIQHYAQKGWPPHAEELLAGFFMKLRYDDLDRMSKLVDDPHPWKVIFRLACTMCRAPYSKELLDLLEQGKENVDLTSKLWVELHGGSEKRFDAMVKRDASPLKKLLKHLERQQTPPPKSPH